MPQEPWELNNFSGFIHNNPRKTERSEIFAQDSVNLRIGVNGELVTRFGQTVVAEIVSGNVTGFVAFRRESEIFVAILNDEVPVWEGK